MHVDPTKRGRIALALPIGLALVLGVYSQVGPAGLITAPLPDLPLPSETQGGAGGAMAAFDKGEWETASRAAHLPVWSLDPSLEYAPAVRAVELTRPWTREGEADALGGVARQLHALGRPGAAFDHAVIAAELGSEKALWHYWAGLIAQGMGERASARAELERAAELDPAYGVTHARLGELYFEEDRLDLADAAYARASDRPPAQSLGLRGRAEIALKRGDAEAALEFIDASIARAPGDYRSHRIRAQALSVLGRDADSVAAVQRASELPVYSGWTTFDPRLSEAIAASGTSQSFEMRLGVALQTGDLAAAAAAAEALLEYRPDSIGTLVSLASIEANRGRIERALELSSRAFQLDPTSVKTLSLHCEVAIKARAAEAIEEATRALLALDTRRAASWAMRARGLFVTDRLDESVAAMERAITLEPRNQDHPLLLAQMLETAGRVEQAAQSVRDALDRIPGSAPLAQRLQQLAR